MTVKRFLSFAGLYFVVGYMGLALAIPPGYSSPVFPAAGLALALALRYGAGAAGAVWLGSFALNCAVALQAGVFSGNSVVLAGMIAFGSAMQSIFASTMVRRFLGTGWEQLDQENAIFKLLGIGGLIACFCSASVGVGSLFAFGVVDASSFFFTWWTWYLGDTLGVFLAVPVCLLLFSPERAVNWVRLRPLWLPLGLALASSGVVFVAASAWEVQNLRDKVAAEGERIQRQLEVRVVAHKEMLASLARLIEINPVLTAEQFDHFTELTLAEQADVSALSYNPLVREEGRDLFERKMGLLLSDEAFAIKQRIDGKLAVAKTAPLHVPVAYISPLEPNKPALGFDIYSEPTRRAAIISSLKRTTNAATAPIRLVQASGERPGILLLSPVFSSEGLLYRKDGISGLAVAVIKADEMLKIAFDQLNIDSLIVTVFDSDPTLSDGGLLFNSTEQAPSRHAEQFAWQQSIAFADRQWAVSVMPTEAFMQANRPLYAWLVGAIGMFLVGLLQVILLASSGRGELVKRRVAEQTRLIESQKLNLEVASEKANAANLAKSRFLATMSHELRTPLNGILGLAKLIELESTEEKQREHAGIIMKSGESLLAVLNDVLDLAKVEAGRIELRDQTFKPAELLADVAKLFESQASYKQIRLKVQWDGDALDTYIADASRIRQMLSNLISNALKFTEAGDVTVVGLSQAGRAGSHSLRFEVRDSGIGIPPEKMEKLFQPFTQLDDSYRRQYGGTGLGLSIVKSMAELMGGQAGVLANEPIGSIFWFSVLGKPCVAQTAPTSNKTSLALSTGNKKSLPAFVGEVFVVEDDAVNQTVIRAFLNKLGVNPQMANNGKEAVEMIQAGLKPNLILMDLQMPVMDGYAATAAILALIRDRQMEPIPIVALTAAAFQDEKDKCLQVGMKDLVAKPVLLDKLIETLDKFLRRK